MEANGDPAATGGAISVWVCGSWDHTGPCPLAPHHISLQQEGNRVQLRVLFATEAEAEQQVRELIVAALGVGTIASPDGRTTTWRLLSHEPAEILPAEVMHAFRLTTSPR
jgi:hypothetical protein